MLFGLGWEARDQIGAQSDLGARSLEALTQINRFGARMAALHALQDHVVAMLQRQMQVRRDAGVGRHQFEQRLVHLDRVERGEAQLLQIGHELEDARDQIAERRRPRQVGAPGREINAGQHDFR